MDERIVWDAEGTAYILSRSVRYPGALNIRPEWTKEVLADPEMLVADPDPKSRIKAVRFIGYSVSAGTVVTIVAWRGDNGELRGINACKTSGRSYVGTRRNDKYGS